MKSLEINKLEIKICECGKNFEVKDKWLDDCCSDCCSKKNEIDEAEKLEKSKNEFWITTPSYNSLNWGSKTVKTYWFNENDEGDGEELEINDKVVKLSDNWFKIVKLNSLPNWLLKNKEELTTFLYLPTKKTQEQVALLQIKKVGSWELVKELKIAPKWTNSAKIRWFVERNENN